MRFKKTVSLAAAGALLFGLAACSADQSEPGEGQFENGALALSFGGLNVPIWNDIIKLVEKDVNDLGYELLIDDPQWDVQKQIADWEAWATRGDVKALVAFPVQADAVVPTTARLVEAGIPVIGYAGKWEGVEYGLVTDAFADGQVTGRDAGNWIKEHYGDAAVSAALLSDRASDLGIARADGIIAGLKEAAPNAVLDELPGATREDGVANTERQLIAKPDTKVWLSTSEENLLGTYRVLMDRGVDPRDPEIMLGVMDVTNESITIIKDGEGESIMRVAYIFPARQLADSIVKLMIAAAEGGEMQDQSILPESVTFENADSYWVD